VELGGFLRFPFGVEPSHLISMGTQERANLVAYNTMGAGQYLNLVRQRAYVVAGETTDVQMTANQNAKEIAEVRKARKMKSQQQGLYKTLP
jgi:hypothetical protein